MGAVSCLRLAEPGVADLLPGRGAQELARLLPELGEPDIHGDPGEARARMFEQLLVLFEHLAESGPLILVIEDAHWSDRSTRDLLAFLVGNQQVLDQVLIVVTFRSDELHRGHPLRPVLAQLDRLGWVMRLELPRLTRREGRELAACLLGREPEPELADRVFSRSEGNPLFLEALLRRDDLLHPGLPESLRDLILADVWRLPAETQEVLRALGVAGQRSGHPLLAAVTGLGDDSLLVALRSAVSANVLVPEGDGYAFRHALIREAILGEVLPGEKTRLHSRLAEILAADPSLVAPGRAVIEQAHHWYAAHDSAQALESAWQAAAAARRALAHAERLAMLARILELWPALPDAAKRIGASHLDVLESAADAAPAAGEDEQGIAFATAALNEIGPNGEPARGSDTGAARPDEIPPGPRRQHRRAAGSGAADAGQPAQCGASADARQVRQADGHVEGACRPRHGRGGPRARSPDGRRRDRGVRIDNSCGGPRSDAGVRTHRPDPGHARAGARPPRAGTGIRSPAPGDHHRV